MPIFHLDMNSYFATAEQQANPFLRGKAIAIGGAPGTRSIVVAASIEAKQYGVKTGMNYWEAREYCPHLQFIDGDPSKYAYLTQQFFDLMKEYTDRVEIYSIDEVFLDMTDWLRDQSQMIAFAKLLKRRLKSEIGDYLTCSIGIAPNRMLAKLASSMKKPDGLTIIDETNRDEVFDWMEITDLPGIGSRLKIRLADMGIRTLKQLGKYPVAHLQKEFGPNYGQMLSNMGKGIDPTEIPHLADYEPTKSMGHTYTLGRDTMDWDEIYSYLLQLSEKVGRRLRRDKYQGRLIWVWLRRADFSGMRERQTLKRFIDDGYEIYQLSKSLLQQKSLRQPVRAIGVGIGLLINQRKQQTMLEQQKRQERLILAQDSLNDRYGEFSIRRARNIRTRLTRKVGGFKEPHQFR